jgi:DNA-binding transcriptional regulator YhcF (GntR family)
MEIEKIEKLLSAVRGGVDLETACHFSGLTISEVYRDLERGKIAAEVQLSGQSLNKEDKECLEIWEQLRKARAESIVRNVATVQQAANNGSWQAATWWLERSVPEIYSKNVADKKAESLKEGKSNHILER